MGWTFLCPVKRWCQVCIRKSGVDICEGRWEINKIVPSTGDVVVYLYIVPFYLCFYGSSVTIFDIKIKRNIILKGWV